jgi:hypothetical protein
MATDIFFGRLTQLSLEQCSKSKALGIRRDRRQMSVFHILAAFPGNAMNAVLIGSQLIHCLITGSVPMIGGAILRAERPGFYSVVVALLTGISGLQIASIHH